MGCSKSTLNTSSPLLLLPTKIQLKIILHLVSSSTSSYFDLKRLSSTCKAYHELIQRPYFNLLLFRGGKATTIPKGAQIALHPLLQLTETFFINSPTSAKIRSTKKNSHKIFTCIDLAAVEEYATSPPVKNLQISGEMILDTYMPGKIKARKGKEGVTVKQVIEEISRMWNSSYNEEVGDVDEDEIDEDGHFHITCWDYGLRMDFFERFSWQGWYRPTVVEDDTARLTPVNFYG